MTHPEKWRDTADPFALPMTRFTLREVLGYPHAGNDVFHVRGEYEGRTVEAYIKAARHQEARIGQEIALLESLKLPELPRLLDWDEAGQWCVTEALPGKRLSVIVGENLQGESLRYMPLWGEALAGFHNLQGQHPSMPRRRFMDASDEGFCHRHGLEKVRAWLENHATSAGEPVLCHGDFHYANLLWQDGRLSGILDLELSGMGDREFDLAWAMLRRPGQRFMTTAAEYRGFLEGYSRRASYDPQRLRWYLVCACAWFCGIGAEDAAYTAFLRNMLDKLVQ